MKTPPSTLQAGEIVDWLVAEISQRLGIERTEIDMRRPFADYGLASREAIVLLGDLERLLDRPLSPALVYEYPTIEAIVAHLTQPEPAASIQAVISEAVRPGEPIAIIGMSCRFPGADSPAAFWQMLIDGVDAIGEPPAERRERDGVLGADPAEAGSKMLTSRGGYLRQVDQFDAEFFGIAPREAPGMDPQQRLMLEVAWEALERAGCQPDRLVNSRTGVFMGISNSDYAQLHLRSGDYGSIDAYAGTGSALSVGVGRLSYALGLQGPNMAIDTACSSSLVAVHLACRSLRAGECNLALAGGVNLILSPEISIFLTQMRALSPDGRCKTFSAEADGYGRGEGCGVVVLKRLSEAQADGDEILAVIRGSAINHDGPSNGLTVPNGAAQQGLLREALADAQVGPAEVDFVEAHGTGTVLGDPIEVRALNAVLGAGRPADSPLVVGAVKANIGHLESAAGVAGLIKSVLALQHETIPAQIHFNAPNPYVQWEAIPVVVASRTLPWPAGRKRRLAGVSSFGFSGTNAHVVLEEAPRTAAPRTAAPSRIAAGPAGERPLHVLALAGKRAADLAAAADNGRKFLNTPGLSVADACYSLNTGRAQFAHRLAVVGATADEMSERLAAHLRGERPDGVHAGMQAGAPGVVFMFAGQGAQYAGMSRELYETQPIFRRTLEQCAELLEPHLARPLLDVLFADSSQLLDQTAYTQPALFAVEYALAELWRSWGIRPALVLGHSVGEIVAATVAGVFSLEDGLRLTAIRSRLIQALAAGGQMVAVRVDEARAAAALNGYSDQAAIAAINGPESVVIAGAAEAVAAVVERLEAEGVGGNGSGEDAKRGVGSTRLNVSHAFHSPLMEPALAPFEAAARTVTFNEPQMPIVSNVTGRVVEDGELSKAEYWARHVQEPVRFAAGLEAALAAGGRVFLEIGPGTTLTALGRQVASQQAALDAVWLPSLRRGRSDWEQMLDSLATLYAQGVEVDWAGFDRDYGRRRVDAPTYPFQRKRFWVERPGQKRAGARRRTSAGDGFLGAAVHSPVSGAVTFESRLDADSLPFAEHEIYETVVAPASGHVSLLLSAAEAVYGEGPVTLSDLMFRRALVVSPGQDVTMQVILTPGEKDGAAAIEIYSAPADRVADRRAWTLHVSGTLQAEGGRLEDAEGDRLTLPDGLGEPAATLYETMSRQGFTLGGGFRWLERLWGGQDEAMGRMRAPMATDRAERYVLHPGLIDSLFQLIGGSTPAGEMDESAAYVPVGLERFRFLRRPGGALWASARLRAGEGTDGGSFAGDLRLFDEQGGLIAVAEGLHVRRAARELLLRSVRSVTATGAFEVVWRPAATVDDRTGESGGNWLVFGQASGAAGRVADQLNQTGSAAILVQPGERFREAAAGQYEIRADQAQQYRRLLAEVRDRMGPIGGVVFMWGRDEDRPGDAELAAEIAARGLLYLVQALALLDEETPRVWIVTRGAQAAAMDDPPVVPEQTLLWGMGRTLALEMPEMWGGLIDLDARGSGEEGRQIVDEIRAAANGEQVALRGGQRLVSRLEPAPVMADGPAPVRFRPDAGYLITGGFGAIGGHFARWMVGNGARYVALLGRSVDTAAARGLIAELEGAGATVRVYRADVSKRDELAGVFDEMDAAGIELRGVVHAAGALNDGAMVGQSWDEFSMALAAKVAGGRHLHELTAGRQLEFFVLCSSVAAVIGSLGQANYTAANSFLDGLAHYRRGLGLPALSVNWGPWAASGMAAQLTALERQREGALNAFRPIDAGEALDWMQGAVNGGLAQRVYAPVDWALLFERAPVLRGRPLLAGFVEPVLSRPQPVRAPVSLTLLDSLARLPMGERRDYLYAFTREQAAAVLHIKPAEQIGPEQPLSALGMDSLMALDLARSLGEAVGHKLSPTLLFNHSTVEALTDHLAELLAIRPEAAQAQQPVDVDEQWAQQALAEIRGLSDEELNRMLESELSELLDGS